jgi:sugar O-acyltransferase (sialic acid O-acetyltransferase NeuD family)
MAVTAAHKKKKTMKRLIIVGAGGFAREVLAWAQDVQARGSEWSVAGFLDDNQNVLKSYNYKIPIIDSIQDYTPKKNDLFVIGIAAPTKIKMEIAKLIKDKGAVFIQLIHPSVIIGNNVSIGEGCVICPNATLSCDIKIGDFVTINAFAGIGHDVTIDNGATINSYVNINGHCKIGEGVEFGSHATVVPGVSIGSYAKIGVGSAVIKNVKPNVTVMGVPAKKII